MRRCHRAVAKGNEMSAETFGLLVLVVFVFALWILK